MPTQYHLEYLTLLTESSKKLHTKHYFIHIGHFQNKPHLGHLRGHLEFLKTLNNVIMSSNTVMSSNQSTIKTTIYNTHTT